MAGGAAGTPNQQGSATPAAPSQASQYSGSYAQPPIPAYQGAPFQGGQQYQPQQGFNQSQPMQSYQPQFGGGYGQGYGSPFGGMGGFPGQGFGYQMPMQQPQYGYGGMGNQFMGGGMYAPRGGFDEMMGQMYGGDRRFGGGFSEMPMQAAVQAQPEAQPQPVAQQPQRPEFGGFRGPRRGFGGYGRFDPRMMRAGLGGYEY